MTGSNLDGVSFTVVISRRPDDRWLVRVFGPGVHEIVHDTTGSDYAQGLSGAHRAMAEWVRNNGGGPR